MALKRTTISFVAGLALWITVSPGMAAEGVTAESLIERAETLFRQLDAADPAIGDPDSWKALASAYAAVPERFPTHPLAGHALWRVGEIRAREHRAGDLASLERAVAAYELLISRYPTSLRAPGAYLALAELDSPSAASTHYYRLLRRYPGSPEASEARDRLAGATSLEPLPERAETPSDPPPAPADEAPVAAFENEHMPTDEVLEASPTPASRTSSSAEFAAEQWEDTPAAETAPEPTPDPPADLGLGAVLGVRHFAGDKVTRVVLDLDRPIRHEIGEAQSPPRVFVDLIGARLPDGIPSEAAIAGPGVERVRIGVNRPGVVRVVLDLAYDARYSFFSLADPHRLVVDIPNAELSDQLAHARRPPRPEGGAEARQLSLGVRRVVIDPGHGGTAPGAIGRSGITEKELTLDIARRLAGNLRASGYDVLLTREEDRSLPLEDRPVRATAAGADLFVSIHVNSSTNRGLSGFETYYLDLATDPTAAETAARENASASAGLGSLDSLLDEIVKNANKVESRDLAHSIQDSLVLQMTRDHDGIRDLGVKHAPFIVLVGARMPAVLVECSFLSHEEEERRLRDPDYRQRVADAIHIGIENFAAKRRMVTGAY